MTGPEGPVTFLGGKRESCCHVILELCHALLGGCLGGGERVGDRLDDFEVALHLRLGTRGADNGSVAPLVEQKDRVGAGKLIGALGHVCRSGGRASQSRGRIATQVSHRCRHEREVVHADRERLGQVHAMLLSNSIQLIGQGLALRVEARGEVGEEQGGGDAILVRELDANVVIFADGSFRKASDLNELSADLEDLPINLIVAPALTNISDSRTHIRPISGIPLVHVDLPTTVQASRLGKRLFDILGATIALILSLPIALVVCLLIKIEDGGPIIFRQQRVGRKGVEFSCLKFRSMVVGADKLRNDIDHLNESDGALFKVKDDPRITKVGKVIRRFSVDVLPQLINVIRGDMSLVGPRPALPREVATYDRQLMRRLEVRPGLTGLWQVSGRSDPSWDESVRLDLYYVNNWSMVRDIVIVLRTFAAVLRGSGAY